jgi:hypothetical protein
MDLAILGSEQAGVGSVSPAFAIAAASGMLLVAISVISEFCDPPSAQPAVVGFRIPYSPSQFFAK